ncbi:MAG: hypothetical protein L0228_12055 [Planctomycetes bacterium]|nr:hypothetical protein [Planctomycetota bacterium]
MGEREFLDVDPAELYLPGSRRGGADVRKLQRQFSRFGASAGRMPPLEVSRGSDGALVLNDSVTRATRIARYAPGIPVTVEVIDELPVPVAQLPAIGETL